MCRVFLLFVLFLLLMIGQGNWSVASRIISFVQPRTHIHTVQYAHTYRYTIVGTVCTLELQTDGGRKFSNQNQKFPKMNSEKCLKNAYRGQS